MSKQNLIVIASITGSDGDVTVEFSNATFQDGWDNTLQYPHPEFGSWLIEQIFFREKILAVKKGILLKNYYCPTCIVELEISMKSPREASFELQFMDLAPFTMSIKMPAVTCPQCYKVCGIDINGNLKYQIPEAIIRAFESVLIKPSEAIHQIQCKFYLNNGIRCTKEVIKGREYCWKHDNQYIVTYGGIVLAVICICLVSLIYFSS